MKLEGWGRKLRRKERDRNVRAEGNLSVFQETLYCCTGHGMWPRFREPKEISLENFCISLFIKLNLISRNLLSSYLFNFLIYPVRDQHVSPTPPSQYCTDLRGRLTHPEHPSLLHIHSVSLSYVVILTALKECSLMLLLNRCFKTLGHSVQVL